MKRLLGLAAFAALLLPAQAGAKGFIALSVCGTNGCHTTRDKQELAGAQDATPQADPGRSGAFYKLRIAVGEPGRKGAFAHVTSEWMPSIGVIRGEEGPYSGYTLPQPATKRVLVRLSRGLEAFPASSMPRAQGGPSSARVAEVVPAATRTTSGEDGDGSAWKLSLLAILPLGLLVGLRRRRKS